MTPRDDLDRWLLSESQRDDDLADAAFARVMRDLPAFRPAHEFTDAVLAAWRQRQRAIRHRRIELIGVVLLCVASVAVGLITFQHLGSSIVDIGAGLLSRTLWTLVAFLHASARFWSVAQRMSSVTATVLSNQIGAFTLFALEIVAIGSLLMLRRVLRGFHDDDRSMEAWT
jgi:hypothetical protein